jgi:hypothetical protein
MFKAHSSDKELISRIYKRSQKKSNTKRTFNEPINEWTNELKRQFSKVQMANKCMEEGSTSLAIKDMQVKTTLGFHLTWSE